MTIRQIVGVLVAAVSAAVLTACSGSAPAPAPTTDHNAADVAFLQGMIPHHAQAIAMSGQVPSRAASPEVKDLAARIDRAQGPEIEQMTGMLDSWGEPRPQPGSMGGMTMNGMMSDQQMGRLAAASGPAFDRMFLTMMIEHHRGAVTMSRTELAQGQNPQAEQLAEKIIAAQQAEITEMQALLARV